MTDASEADCNNPIRARLEDGASTSVFPSQAVSAEAIADDCSSVAFLDVDGLIRRATVDAEIIQVRAALGLDEDD